MNNNLEQRMEMYEKKMDILIETSNLILREVIKIKNTQEEQGNDIKSLKLTVKEIWEAVALVGNKVF